MTRLCRLTLLVWLGCVAASVNAFAQQLSIAGTVDDGAGVVPEAHVTLRQGTAVTHKITTNVVGQYRFDNLNAGEYELTVSRDGYAVVTRAVTLSGQSSTVDVTLQVAGISASVEVTGVTGGGLANNLVALTTAGSRLNLSSLETPASVATLDGADIRLRGDANINTAVTRATGLTTAASYGGGGNSVTVRGFTDNNIAFLYDGIRNAAELGNLSWPYDPWTVERIEVLNGPASVLFGIGGIGGSINIIPRRPNRNPEHTVHLSGGGFDTYKLALDSTGPLSERVLYRFDFSRQQSDGYVDQARSESTAVSGSMAFLLSDTLKATVMNDWAFIRPMIYNGLPMVNGQALRELRDKNYGTNDLDVHFNENSTRFELDWTPNPTLSVKNVATVLKGDRLWHSGPWQLNYRPATNDIIGDFYGNWDQDQLQFNNQISLTARRPLAGREHTVVVGGDVEKLDFTRIVTLFPDLTSEFDLLNPGPGNRPTTGGVISSALTALVTRYSIFAEDRLKLTPVISVVGGLRYDHQTWGRVELATPGRTRVDRIDDPVNWRVGGVFTVRPNTNLYGQYSVATDRGAWIAEATVEQMGLKPTRGGQIEVGVKQSLGGGRMEWTLAGYRIRKTDLLMFNRSPTFAPGEIAEQYLQVGSQSSRGLEATLTFDAGRGLRVSANGTVLDPTFDEFFEDVDGVPTSRNGNRPFNVPWQSGNLMATWAFHQGWLAQGAVRFVGKRFIDTANTQSLPGYTVVDGGLRWSASSRVAIDLRVGNLFDAFYPFNFAGNGRGGGNWLAGAPRSFEIALTTGL